MSFNPLRTHVEKPAETQTSNRLASPLARVSNSWSGGQEFESAVCGPAWHAKRKSKTLAVRSPLKTPEIGGKMTTFTLFLIYCLWILEGKARVLSGTSTSENFSQSINTHVSKVWAKHIGNFILCWKYFLFMTQLSCYSADGWITLYVLQKTHAVVWSIYSY